MNAFLESEKPVSELKQILDHYDNLSKRRCPLGLKRRKDDETKKQRLEYSESLTEKDNHKTKHLESGNIEKWYHVIPDSRESQVIDQCFVDAVEGVLTGFANESSEVSQVYHYLIWILKGLPLPSKGFLGQEALIILNLINDLERLAIALGGNSNADESRSMSDAFWSLMQQKEQRKSVMSILSEVYHEKDSLSYIDSEGNVCVDANVLFRSLIDSLNPFRTTSKIVFLTPEENDASIEESVSSPVSSSSTLSFLASDDEGSIEDALDS